MAQDHPPRRFLNAGSGTPGPRRLPAFLAAPGWSEVRLDVEPRVEPDVLGTVVDVAELFEPGSFDAVWSSHNLEHLFAHEVPIALAGFCRVLKPDGFALVTCPDLEGVAAALVEHGLDHVAYTAPAGPISVRDMIFGHGASIAAGFPAMAHRSGLTQASLGRLALAAGFIEVRVGRGRAYDLWGVLAMPDCPLPALERLFGAGELAFLFADGPPEAAP